jgi:hypothetical protein
MLWWNVLLQFAEQKTVRMAVEAGGSSKTLVPTDGTVWCHNRQDYSLSCYSCVKVYAGVSWEHPPGSSTLSIIQYILPSSDEMGVFWSTVVTNTCTGSWIKQSAAQSVIVCASSLKKSRPKFLRAYFLRHHLHAARYSFYIFAHCNCLFLCDAIFGYWLMLFCLWYCDVFEYRH